MFYLILRSEPKLKIMRKFIFVIIFVLLSLLIFALSILRNISWAGQYVDQKKKTSPVDYIGEKIIYDVKINTLKLGQARFSRLKDAKLGNKSVSCVTFETQITNFYDLEEIYSDLESGLPIKIIRNIRSLSGKEKIIESYDQQNFTLNITKFKGKRKAELKIKRDIPIQNAIMLPFYLRRTPVLKVGWNLTVQLPKQKFTIKLAAIEKIRIGKTIFEAYRFTSVPKKFEIWVTTDKQRIPIKINGAGIFGYSLVMREYNADNLSKSSPTVNK